MNLPTKHVTLISIFIALGAASEFALHYPGLFLTPFHGVLAGIELVDVLAFAIGWTLGIFQGFLVGVGSVLIGDFLRGGIGPWTPFMAIIIGLWGIAGGIVSKVNRNPGSEFLGAISIPLTILSESLQNLWFACFTPGITFLLAQVMGLKTMVICIGSNFVLFTTLGKLLITQIRKQVT